VANQIAGHKIADYTNEDNQTQNINETVTSLALNTNSLDYVDENGSTSNIDLSGYLDNTDSQTLSLSNNTLAISGGNSVNFTTDNVNEGTNNLYFTNARADTRIAAAKIEDLSNVNSAAATNGQILS